MYKVIQDLTVKVKGTVKIFYVGSVVKLPFQAAQMFIQQGKIEPMIEAPTKTDEPEIADYDDSNIPYVDENLKELVTFFEEKKKETDLMNVEIFTEETT